MQPTTGGEEKSEAQDTCHAFVMARNVVISWYASMIGILAPPHESRRVSMAQGMVGEGAEFW